MRKLTKALTVVSLLAPVSGHPLGIGDIRVRSALNQNLNAEITLVASRGENPTNIKVSLAPPEKFDEAGVPWSYFLSKIRFQPVVKPNGSMVIKVTSREALKEPYLNFLLEVSWPKGNLYREFTVLVDPPAEYQQPSYQEPSYQEPAYPLSSTYENTLPPQQEYVPRRRVARHHALRPRRNSAGSYGGQITTRRNDTLWNVADRARGEDVSVEQMIMALYEKNPHAFYQQNVNALSAGEKLQIPDKAVVQQLSRQDALAAFGQHEEAWNNNRSGIPAGETQAAKENVVDSQLKLEAPAEATVGANETVSPSSEQTAGTSQAAPSQPTPLASETQQQAPADKTATPIDNAVQSKVAALEKQMAMMQELIALKDKQLAELQNPGQTTAPATETPPAQTEPPVPPTTTPAPPEQVAPPVTPPPPIQTAPAQAQPAQPVVPPKPVVKPAVKKPVQPPEPVEEASPLPWILGGLGGILVPLFGWLWWKKRKINQETDAESMFRNYSTMRDSGSLGPYSAARKTGGGTAGAVSGDSSSFLNDFKASDFESFESFNVDHGDIDPLAEADVYLAYGRYQQAEDLIRQAVKEYPDRDDCKLKLLEIFHASSNKEDFESYASELVSAGKKDNKDFWQKVIELSKDISPDSVLFSSAIASTTAIFSAEPDVLTENVLLSPSTEQGSTGKSPEATDNQGVATFDISDIDEGEALFDTIPAIETPSQHEDEPFVATVKAESSGDRPDLDHNMPEVDLAGQQGNESLDFDLGPYPGSDKDGSVNVSANETKPLDNLAANPQMDELDDKNEFETYEFDFNPSTTEAKEPAKVAEAQEKDTWDLDNTLEFSFDKPLETNALDNDALDFGFEPQMPQKAGDQNRGFMVSDLTDMDEVETKLDLAKAYIDMGDASAAKEIIVQVIEHGSAEQKQTAQMLLDELS